METFEDTKMVSQSFYNTVLFVNLMDYFIFKPIRLIKMFSGIVQMESFIEDCIKAQNIYRYV